MTSSAVGLKNHSRLALSLTLNSTSLRGFVAAALLPDFLRLERGHEHFDGAGPVHFLADDLLDLAQRAQAERQKSINAAGQLADEAGAQQQFVRNNFRVSRGFAERRNQSLCPLHVAERLTTKEPRNEDLFLSGNAGRLKTLNGPSRAMISRMAATSSLSLSRQEPCLKENQILRREIRECGRRRFPDGAGAGGNHRAICLSRVVKTCRDRNLR